MKAAVGVAKVGWLFEGVTKTEGLLTLEEGMVAALLETIEMKTEDQ